MSTFPSDLAEAVHGMTFHELDEFVSAMFERSDQLPYIFSKAIYCNLKKREDIKNEEAAKANVFYLSERR